MPVFSKSMKLTKIPTILGVVVLLAGVIGGVILVGQRQGFSLRASPTAEPKQVKITNIGEKSAVVSWITDTNVAGFVKYGEASGSLGKTQGDDRDRKSGTQGKYTTHYVTIEGLKANTNYALKIGSGSKTYGNDGKNYTFKTAAVMANPPKADTISGKVLLAGGQAAPGVMVYVDIDGATTMSALSTQQGNWNLTLSNARTKDMTKYAAYDIEKAKLTIFVQGGDLGTATATTLSANDSPVADITLGQNQNFVAGGNVASGSANLATITIRDNQVSPADLTALPGSVVNISNSDAVPHTITGKAKEFDSGVIAAGTNGAITMPITPGDYAYIDSTQPTVVSMMGTIRVQSQLAVLGPTATPSATPTGSQLGVTPTATPSGTSDDEVVADGDTDGAGGFGDLIEEEPTPEETGVVTLINPGNEENVATTMPEIKVKGPSGKKITISVHSDNPQSDTMVIGDTGLVDWTPPEGLSPGEHEVTIEYEDDNGILQTITRKFTVLASEGETMDELPAFTASPSGTIKTPTPSKRSTMPATSSGVPEPGATLPTMLLLGIGFLMFSGGIALQLRERHE